MKTTLELPDDLIRKLRVRVAENDRRLKDVVTDLIELGLEASNSSRAPDPLHAWLNKLETRADGSITNPDDIDDPDFSRALDEVREERSSRACASAAATPYSHRPLRDTSCAKAVPGIALEDWFTES